MPLNFAYQGRELRVESEIGEAKGGKSYLVYDGLKPYVCKHFQITGQRDIGRLDRQLQAYDQLASENIPVPELLEINEQGNYLIKEYLNGDLVSHLSAAGAITTDYYLQAFSISERCRKAGINLDYFPSNFLCHNDRIYYLDYEVNDYLSEWDFTHWGIYYWLNQEGMKHFNETGSIDLIQQESMKSLPRTLGFESRVAELKALYQHSQR